MLISTHFRVLALTFLARYLMRPDYIISIGGVHLMSDADSLA